MRLSANRPVGDSNWYIRLVTGFGECNNKHWARKRGRFESRRNILWSERLVRRLVRFRPMSEKERTDIVMRLCGWLFAKRLDSVRLGCGLVLAISALFCQAASGATVDFESVPVGTKFGFTGGNDPGDVVLVQDAIAMSVEFLSIAPTVNFFQATVGGDFAPLMPTTPLSVNNIDLRFDFSGLGFNVTQVTVDFREFSGINDFRVNDGVNHVVGTFSDLPSEVSPGVFATVAAHPNITDVEVITLTGASIQSFQLGGQELVIDNIVATPEPGTALLLLCGCAAIARKRRRA